MIVLGDKQAATLQTATDPKFGPGYDLFCCARIRPLISGFKSCFLWRAARQGP
jgi:hypothetical protein